MLAQCVVLSFISGTHGGAPQLVALAREEARRLSRELCVMRLSALVRSERHDAAVRRWPPLASAPDSAEAPCDSKIEFVLSLMKLGS